MEEKKKRKDYNFLKQEKLKKGILGNVNYIYDNMIKFQWSFNEYLERKNSLFEYSLFNELSTYNQYYIHGYMEARKYLIEKDNIVWLHYHPTLGLIKNKDVPTSDWSIIDSDKSGYFWKDTKKLYYKSKKENDEKIQTE